MKMLRPSLRLALLGGAVVFTGPALSRSIDAVDPFAASASWESLFTRSPDPATSLAKRDDPFVTIAQLLPKGEARYRLMHNTIDGAQAYANINPVLQGRTLTSTFNSYGDLVAVDPTINQRTRIAMGTGHPSERTNNDVSETKSYKSKIEGHC
jgi:hypothetical protein